MENAKEIYQYVLGAIIVAGILTIIGFLVWRPIPEVNNDLLYLLLGALVAKFGDVVAYFFGSSKGSADKTKLLKQ